MTKELFPHDITPDTIIGYYDGRLFRGVVSDHYKIQEEKEKTKYDDHRIRNPPSVCDLSYTIQLGDFNLY